MCTNLAPTLGSSQHGHPPQRGKGAFSSASCWGEGEGPASLGKAAMTRCTNNIYLTKLPVVKWYTQRHTAIPCNASMVESGDTTERNTVLGVGRTPLAANIVLSAAECSKIGDSQCLLWQHDRDFRVPAPDRALSRGRPVIVNDINTCAQLVNKGRHR